MRMRAGSQAIERQKIERQKIERHKGKCVVEEWWVRKQRRLRKLRDKRGRWEEAGGDTSSSTCSGTLRDYELKHLQVEHCAIPPQAPPGHTSDRSAAVSASIKVCPAVACTTCNSS